MPQLSTPVTFDHLRLIAELVSDLVYQTNKDGIIDWVSPSVTALLGWEQEEILGTPSANLIHRDDLPDALFHRSEQDTGKAVEDHLTRMRTGTGSYRWMSVRLRSIRNDDGRVVARVIGAHDIHEEMTVRKALRTLSQGSSVLVRETSESGLLQSMCDTIVESGQYLFAFYLRPVYDAAKSVETVARASNPLSSYGPISVTWGDVPTADDPAGRAIRTGEVQISQDFLNDPLTDRWKPGASLAGIRSVIALPVLVSGRIDGVLAVYGAEVDEFNQAAQVPLADLADALGYGLTRLREQVRLRAVGESLMDPHILLDPIRDKTGCIVDFTYVDANKAACDYMGMEHSQVIGTRLLELLPGHVDSGALALYANVVDSGQPLALDNYPYDNEILGSVTFSDIRAIQVGRALVLTWRDVTDRYAAAVALTASEEQYRLLAENSFDVVLRLSEGVIGWVSPSVTDMLGWSQNELVGRHLDELVQPEDLGTFLECQSTILEKRGLHIARLRMLAQDLSYHWVEIRAKPYVDSKGEWDGAVASFHTIDAQVAAEEALERRARYDELTGLLNRSDMIDRLSAISSHILRTGHEIAVMFCDVDEFKSVNDSNGHATGDQVLRSIAGRIKESVRMGDLIARIGGDEFLVVLDGVHDLNEAVGIAEKLCRRVAEPIQIGDGTISATLSIGVTLARPGENPDDLVARADQAMYKAKEAGSDQVIAIAADSA